MLTTSALKRASKQTPREPVVVEIDLKVQAWTYKQKGDKQMSRDTPEIPKSSQSDLSSLAKPTLDYLLEFERITVECHFNYTAPSWEFVKAVERELKSFDDSLLRDIRELDDRLELKGRALNGLVIWRNLSKISRRRRILRSSKGWVRMSLRQNHICRTSLASPTTHKFKKMQQSHITQFISLL